jgi:NADH-quinone oxidoreductase subunit E
MTTQGAESIQFKTETLEFIQEWKEKSGNLIMILHKVQEDFGYIPKPAAIKLSELLGVPLAKIYGVITFYHYFKLEKPGKHKISVCTGTACYLKGSDDILMELEQILGIGVNATTADGEFSIEAVDAWAVVVWPRWLPWVKRFLGRSPRIRCQRLSPNSKARIDGACRRLRRFAAGALPGGKFFYFPFLGKLRG